MNKGEIWILDFPSKSGKEQEGTRPAIILATTEVGMIISVPLTSKIQAKKFPHTVLINKSERNNLEQDSIALIFQIRSLDKQKFRYKVGNLEDYYLHKIDEELKSLLKI